jgi:hypothetical protein
MRARGSGVRAQKSGLRAAPGRRASGRKAPAPAERDREVRGWAAPGRANRREARGRAGWRHAAPGRPAQALAHHRAAGVQAHPRVARGRAHRRARGWAGPHLLAPDGEDQGRDAVAGPAPG